MEDFILVLLIVVGSFFLGFMTGGNHEEATIYAACETKKEFVMEVHGVPQTYSCVRTK